jgi:hypothetical protein
MPMGDLKTKYLKYHLCRQGPYNLAKFENSINRI